MITRIITGFILLVSFQSCVTQRRCSEKYPPQVLVHESVKDSIIIVKDTFYTEPTQITFHDSIPCPPNISYHHAVSHAGVTATGDIHNGVITIDCKTDSLECVIETQNHIITTLHEQTTIPKPEIIYKVHSFDQFCRWWFFITLILILLYVGVKSIKK